MSEQDIRQIIKQVCQDLDGRAMMRKVALAGRKVVLPAMLGATMALSGGCLESESEPVYAAPDVDAGSIAEYAAPDLPDGGGDDAAIDAPVYAAPDVDTGVEPLYAAVDVDGGAVAEYAAPDIDAGNTEVYGTPDPQQ